MGNNELDQAYATLGLDRTATKEDVEKKYDLLLRRERASKQQAGANSDSESFEAVHRAYRLILQHEDQKDVATIQAEKYGKYKQYAGLVAKIDHFFSYYKWHLVGAIAAVALLVYGVSAYIDHREEQARLAALPPPDLEIMVLGKFYLPNNDNNMDPIEAAIVNQVPGWQRVEAEYLAVNMSEQGMTDVALQQKAVVMLATERPDVYILDQDSFRWIANSGALETLDADASGRLAGKVPEEAHAKAPEPPEGVGPGEEAPPGPEHVYGINVGGTAFADDLTFVYEDMIIGIRQDAERRDNALQWIERFFAAEGQ